MAGKLLALPTLVIVSGMSGTGKTTLAEQIARRFNLPAMHKDAIKEPLCDVLGCTNYSESRRLGRASMALLYTFAGALLRAQHSCLIESNFIPRFSIPDLLDLQQRYPFLPLQIHCHTAPAISFRRYKERFEAGLRHPGHMDAEHIQSMEASFQFNPELLQPLTLDGPLIEVDTTDFAAIDYEALFAQIEKALVAEE